MFIIGAFGRLSKKLLPSPAWQRRSFMFPLKCFYFLALTFKYLIHLELVFRHISCEVNFVRIDTAVPPLFVGDVFQDPQ